MPRAHFGRRDHPNKSKESLQLERTPCGSTLRSWSKQRSARRQPAEVKNRRARGSNLPGLQTGAALAGRCRKQQGSASTIFPIIRKMGECEQVGVPRRQFTDPNIRKFVRRMNFPRDVIALGFVTPVRVAARPISHAEYLLVTWLGHPRRVMRITLLMTTLTHRRPTTLRVRMVGTTTNFRHGCHAMNVPRAVFLSSRVRMMPAATQHRMSGERNQRQALEEAGNHRFKILGMEVVGGSSSFPIDSIGSSGNIS